MKLRTALVTTLLFTLPILAGDLMKITLKDGSVSEERLENITAILFENNQLISLESHDLDLIQKIEFDSDGTAIIGSGGDKGISSSKATLSMKQLNKQLSINTTVKNQISVSLYAMNGRKVAELFNGTAQSELNFDLSKQKLAAGIYSIVVKSGSELFVQKMVQK